MVNGINGSLGSWTWNIAGGYASTANGRIRIVEEGSNTNTRSESGSSFKIAKIAVVAPTNGAVIQTGKTYKIRWTSEQIENARIRYSSDNGNSWMVIAASVQASLGELDYVFGSTAATDQGKIEISDASDNTGFRARRMREYLR